MSSASVNLTTETAVVWPMSEAKVTPNWQKQLGETLAKHLTNCGFKSNLRGKHFTSSSPSVCYCYLLFAFEYGFHGSHLLKSCMLG